MLLVEQQVRWLVLSAFILLGGRFDLPSRAIKVTPVGRVLYLRLRLAPYPDGASKEMRYWIDATNGRIRYLEALAPSGTQASSKLTWYTTALRLRPDGRCVATYSTLLRRSMMGNSFSCASLIALRDVAGLRARAFALRRRYAAHTRLTARTIQVSVPAGTDLITPIIDRFNMTFGYETMVPGVLVLERSSGRPLSISGYHRDDATMTESILEARDLALGSLPNTFFD